MTKQTDAFCTYCAQFACGMVDSRVVCSNCGASWSSRSPYWNALDEWEATHKKKIDDLKKERKRSYITSGQIEKDIAVLTAQVTLDTASDIAQKMLEIMENDGHANPRTALNKLATQLGFIVGDARRDLAQACRDAEEVEEAEND